ncbi:MAG: hypothetical protein LBT19_01940 [Candidatus Nomurabacteria bacterium]|jgi:FKBP-type peptidyl-prolyl cis-trans isomerase (trigger factor)|nr:hypothetical protein [Candidatus Nomurabacteria bacterium]
MENVEQFIDQLITDKGVSGLTDEVRAELKTDLTQRLVDQIDRAVIDALPEEKAIELSERLDDENFGDDQVNDFVRESGIDVQNIALQTMLKFRELYLGAGN